MKTIKEIEITGKKVFIRVDFNVPMDEQQNITEDTRIRTVLPTLEYALSQNAKIILASHLGRPKGKKAPEMSLKPVAEHLSKLVNKDVIMAPDCIGSDVEELVSKMKDGDIVLLENLRYYDEEQANDKDFAAKLGSLCDVYINNAFAVSHRVHASVAAITETVKDCGAGLLLEKEINYYQKAMENPKRPLVAIVGGAKISSKLAALENMLNKVDKVIIGGAMANTFLKSQGYNVGASMVEDDILDTAADVIKTAKAKGIDFYIPVDVVAAEKFNKDADSKTVSIDEIPEGWMALDVGTKTAKLYSDVVKTAGTVVWNGPMGVFEMEIFSKGTMTVAESVADCDALTIIGGGDTDAAVHKAGLEDKMSYISTGGGAFLKLMEGKTLPGVTFLNEAEKRNA